MQRSVVQLGIYRTSATAPLDYSCDPYTHGQYSWVYATGDPEGT